MSTKLPKSILFSCYLAGCLEMYDFTIFGFLAATLHKNYLVFLDEASALIMTYTLFAVGFLIRPLGAIIFGYIGDKYGRKKALVTSVSMMGIASLVMFALPPYAILGIVSCYIIALVRIIQGISVGGEFTGALVYAIEHFTKKKAGFVGGIVICGTVSGALLSNVVSSILQNPTLPEYSWRFAFLLGFGLSIVGFFIRKKLTESPEFKKITVARKKIPLLEGLKQHRVKCLSAFLIAGAAGVNFYFMVVFLPTYIKTIHELDFGWVSMVIPAICVVAAPFFGWLSDYYDRKKILSAGILTMSIYGFAVIRIFSPELSNVTTCLLFSGYGLIFATIASNLNTFIVEMFPPECRFSCASFCYSLGIGFIGGTSPMVASLMLKLDNPSVYISGYILIVSILGYVGVKIVEKTHIQEEVRLIKTKSLV